ncbi:MASE4 domain-containing protein [Dongia sedimenti]|uniref:histidine kinase n=1 Tax=Dongia sedimenti TaxID=3064282 RepID=A0ABU0YM01_9PROT|nr:MASE4 domain-containing protein [Rhodospirillaceae bacterium R-7]
MVQDRGIFLSILPATRGERRLALTVVAISLGVFLVCLPFAKQPILHIDAFIPAYAATVTINDLITAVLLFGQFTLLGKRGLMFLACGYLFTSLMAVSHMFSFPGLLAPAGLLTGGSQTTVWLYMFWHAGLPTMVLLYALRGDADMPGRGGVAIAAGCAVGAVLAVVLLTTLGHDLMPVLLFVVDGVPYYTLAFRIVVGAVAALSLLALTAVWRRKSHSVLDIWLMATMCIWFFDISLSAMLNERRFDLGFYVGRIYGALAASFILLVLLLETRALFSRLAGSLERRAGELSLANAALQESEGRLKQLNETLEQRVAERSSALEAEIAERNRIHETMRETQKLEAIGQMAGGIAHDFNNLLTVVMGNAGFLEDRLAAGPERQAAGTIVRAAERGARLVRQILAFSRRQAVKPEVIELTGRSTELVDLLRRSTRGDIRIVADFPNDLWPFECDAAELELALMNLCVNARDAMPSGGLVRVHACNCPNGVAPDASGAGSRVGGLVPNPDGPPLGDFVRISVTDTGTGIAPEVLAKAFEPFFTTKEIGKGTGLGLSQVYGFAQQAGGAAEIESAVGIGTTVSIFLPRSMAAAGAETAESKAATDARTPAGGSVLLVEDDEDVAVAAMTILGMIGYRAQHVPNGGTALALLLGGEHFDLMLSDIVMPGGMDGLELAQRVRRHFPWLPILLSTGYARPAAEVHQAGFEIIAKPYNAASLLDAVMRARRAAAGANTETA